MYSAPESRRPPCPRGAGRSPGGSAAGLPALVAALLTPALIACGPTGSGDASGSTHGSASGPSTSHAATATDSPVRAVDAAGRRVRLPAPARRVASLVPSATDLLTAMGSADRIVGRTRFDTAPAVEGRPVVSDGLTPRTEALAALRPDLVVAWAGTRGTPAGEALERLELPAFYVRQSTLADLERAARGLGRLLARPAVADSVVRTLRAALDTVRRSLRGVERVPVVWVVWPDPVWTVGGGTYLDRIIRVAGGRNVLGDLGEGWLRVSLEAVVRRDPRVVLVGRQPSSPGAAFLRDHAVWRQLPAVRAGRIHELPAHLFHRPGPQLGRAARRLAAVLHPAAVPARWGPDTDAHGADPLPSSPDE